MDDLLQTIIALLDEYCDCTYSVAEDEEEGGDMTEEEQAELDEATKADIANDTRDLG